MTASLAGRLLVATPALADPNFDRTVVLVLDHGDQGALGVVVNRPTDVDVGGPLPQWEPVAAPPPVVFWGGPVGTGSATVGLASVHLAEEDQAWRSVVGRLGTVDMARHPDDVGQRVDQVRVFTGCAGWGPAQLEGEMGAGAWFAVDARAGDALSSEPRDLWRQVLRRQPGRLAVYSAFPPDPALN